MQSETVVKASGQLAEAAGKVSKLDPEALKDQVAALDVKGGGGSELYGLKCALARIGTLLMT